MSANRPLDVADIARRRQSMESMASIARDYGVSREWIRRVLMSTFGTTWADEVSTERAAARETEMQAYRESILDRVCAGEAVTREDVIAGSPVTVRTAHEVMGDMSWVLVYSQTATPGWDDEAIYATVRRVWESSVKPAPLSRDLYDRNRKESDITGGRICQRMRWHEACERAGVPTNEQPRESYSRLTAENAIRWMTFFLDRTVDGSPEYVGTVRQYEVWAKDYPAAPSSAALRIALGTWNTGRKEAVTRLCQWRRSHPGKAYPEPEHAVSAHARDDVQRWVAMKKADPSRSMASIAREVGVPVGTLRYHLRDL